MMRALVILALLLSGCRQPDRMQLWYWHHSYLSNAAALAESKALVDRAAAAGYTGLGLWDSNLIFVTRPGWNTTYLRQFIAYARSKGLEILPTVMEYGHSDDVLKENPDWAEGQRVIGVKFQRRGSQLMHLPEPPLAVGGGRFAVEPWHQYRVTFAEGATGSVGALDGGNSHEVRLEDVARPGVVVFTFNSAGSSRIHVFGPGPSRLEEVALEHVITRPGAPFRVYDGATEFQEGQDYSGIAVPPGSRIAEGERVSMDYYAVTPIGGEGVGLCLTDPDARRWMLDNARRVAAMVPEGSPLFLQHDEMRHLNSCAACRRQRKTAGELLAWSLRGMIPRLPNRSLYIWSDMFDPWHNARNHYYFVEGDLAGSWEGLPPNVTVMNWNADHRRASLEWFAARGNPQVIAGYYDPISRDGAAAARAELASAMGIRGVRGLMYTTWTNDYSQLEAYALAARAAWVDYDSSKPW